MKAYIFRKKYCLLHFKGFLQRHMYIGCAQVQRGGGGPDHPTWKIHTFLYKIAIGAPFPRKELEPHGK